jgi:hypothetical protein
MSVNVTFDEWSPEQVEKMVRDKLMSRAEDVGKFVETEARSKLDAIRTPDTKRDVNYRSYLSNWMLTNTVTEEGKTVLIRVGMRIGKRGQTHHGFYIETGSRTAPARPYLRPAVFDNRQAIMGLLAD